MIIPTSHVYLYIVLLIYMAASSIHYYVVCFKSLYDWHHKVYIFLQLAFSFLCSVLYLGDSPLVCVALVHFHCSLIFYYEYESATLFWVISCWLMFKWFTFFQIWPLLLKRILHTYIYICVWDLFLSCSTRRGIVGSNGIDILNFYWLLLNFSLECYTTIHFNCVWEFSLLHIFITLGIVRFLCLMDLKCYLVMFNFQFPDYC